MFFSQKRWKHFAAMALIGDGIMAIVRPQHDARAWDTGPKPWRVLMSSLHDHPEITRMIGVAQVVAVSGGRFSRKSLTPKFSR